MRRDDPTVGRRRIGGLLALPQHYGQTRSRSAIGEEVAPAVARGPPKRREQLLDDGS